MSSRPREVAHGRLFPLIAVATSAFVFAGLLILVRLQWSPLESVDHSLAADLDSLVTDRPTVLSVLRAITWMGGGTPLWTLVVAGLIVLAVRPRYRLALFLAIVGVGALTLDPILKALVGRVRPVVEHPVAYGAGNSFPSGHALGPIVCYGTLIVVFLPAVPRRARRPVTIGVTRIDEALAACPRTAEALHRVPGLTTAGSSRMVPGTHIRPHEGWVTTVYRGHLDLLVPEGDCALRAGSTTRPWQEGSLFDFLRPGRTMEGLDEVPPEVAAALHHTTEVAG